jgi:tRNA uridine 5-carboxymethylaminomethyl modification enzyme
MRRARILQHGYAVEYDFVPTEQIRPSLESKRIEGLFLAGQINGTSGYEEAAGQGLIAGINAVRALGRQEPVILGRDQAYIGVMIDDLVTRPPAEPYRMFTSRAEYRLHLRADNADLRLTPIGRRCGLVRDDRWHCFERKRRQIERLGELVADLRVSGRPLDQWLRRPEATLDGLREVLGAAGMDGFSDAALQQVHLQARYAGYLVRQERQIERFRRLESTVIPPDVDFDRMPELRLEARERLTRLGPRTLGQAARISGINPADITVLWVYLTGKRLCPRRPR